MSLRPLWLFLFLCRFAAAETLVVFNHCDLPGCVPMDLHTTGPKAAAHKRTLKDGSQELEFDVRGKPGQGHERALRLIVHPPSGTKDCHGLGPVAVLGLVDDHPILATNGGPVEVVDGSLSVGCQGCLRVIDPETGNPVKEPPAPSRDPEHLGFTPSHFSSDREGAVWLRTGEGVCVKLAREGMFRTGESKLCKPHDDKPLDSATATGFTRYESVRYHLGFALPGC